MIENLLKTENLSLKIIIPAVFLFCFFLPAGIAHAADMYWVGGCSTANWNCDDGATTNWSLTDGGAQHTDIPTAADDVYFTATDASDSTLSAAITINSLDMNGYTGTLTHNASVTLTIDSLNGAGHSLRLASGMTYTNSSGNLSFTSTSGTGKITTAGKTIVGTITFNGAGGTWQLQDELIATNATISLSNGTFDTNNQTVTVSIIATGAGTKTFSFGSSTINLTRTSTGAAFNMAGTGITVSANTATLVFAYGNAYFSDTTTAGLNWNGLSLSWPNGSTAVSAITTTGTVTVQNITFTGSTNKTDVFGFAGNITVAGTFTVNGNSSTNRVLIKSSTLGTARTITAANVSVSNADFQDITGAGAGSWNLSAITGLSGDAGGNSGITFTTAQTQYWVGGAGSWSTAAEWGTTSGGSGGRVPLPQDDVVFDNGSFNGTSQTATMDMPRLGKSMDWSGYNEGQTPTFTPSVSFTMYGSMTLISGMTNGTASFNMEGRGSFTLTSAGKTLQAMTVAMIGGTLTLQDALVSAGNITLSNGTLNANGFNVTTAGIFTISGGNTRTLTMGSGTWTSTYTGSVWNASNVTGLTFNKDTATIVLSNTSATAKTFAGGGLTYNNVVFSGDNITVTGSNTFNTLALNNAGLPTGLLLTSGTTQTVTSFSSNASLGRVAKLLSSSAGSAATISDASGMFCGEYLSIKDSTVTGGASWYAANSTNVSGNTGWLFSQCPAPNTGARTASSSNVKISSSPRPSALAWYSGWGYRKSISINHEKVIGASNFTDFPVLISATSPDLKHTDYGGRVGKTDGTDILFTSSDGTTKLSHEIEKYTSTTGEIVAWVKVPTLNATTNTGLYIYYGNSGATDQQAVTSVWDSNYKGVYHMASKSDSTSNARTLSDAAVSGTATNFGKINGAYTFNGSTQAFTSTAYDADNSADVTLSGWVVPSTLWQNATDKFLFGIDESGATRGLNINYDMDEVGGYLNFTYYRAGVGITRIGFQTNMSANTPYYLSATFDDTNNSQKLYMNGVLVGSRTDTQSIQYATDALFIAKSSLSTYFADAIIDEVRVSNVARSGDWIQTEYNNQNSTSTFYSYGPLEATSRQNLENATVPAVKIRGGVKFR